MPESYFESDAKSGVAHAAQRNVPRRFSSLSGDVNGRSVPSSRRTRYAAGERSARHSAGVFDVIGAEAEAGAEAEVGGGPPRRR